MARKGLFRDKGTSGPNVLNMPAGENFLFHLAGVLRAELGDEFSKALILLPTRRAMRELAEAFLRTAPKDLSASLLPLMRPLADMDPNEPPFEPGELSYEIPPSLDPALRKFMLSKIVLEKEKALQELATDPAAALALSEPLLALLDDLYMEECDPSDFDEFDEIINLSAAHFQHAAELYKIIRNVWPDYLKVENRLDPMQRRVMLLLALAKHWTESPPDFPVIIAGSTGTLPATAELISIVANLKRGAVILPGLDSHISEDSVWTAITQEHPQYGLKKLIHTMEMKREDVRTFPNVSDSGARAARRRLISEALIPADTTGDWLTRIETLNQDSRVDNPFKQGKQGLSLIEAESDDEEARAIALIMRETLEDPEKTAALITPDPTLGRRVRSQLSRWNVHVDITAGDPLSESPAGLFLLLVLELAVDPFNGVALAALMRHPLTALGQSDEAVRRQWQAIEIEGFRGLSPRSLEELRSRFKEPTALQQSGLNNFEKLHQLLTELGEHIDRLPSDFAALHVKAAEAIVQSEVGSGAARLWSGEDGEVAASVLSDLIRHSDVLGALDLAAYRRLLSQLIQDKVIRPDIRRSHPRLKILGPLEARMIHSDVTILGGLNEGIWPAPPSPDPLLPRSVREKLGLTLPERRYGLAAHDFAQLASAPTVFLTRSKRDSEGPTVASRWLWRLKTLMRGALCPNADNHDAEEIVIEALAPETNYLAIARELDFVAPNNVTRAVEPKPCPPKASRPDRLSVTQIETLVRDPYAIYARKILGLDVLNNLNETPGPAEFGSAIHKALEEFNKAEDHSDNREEILQDRFETQLSLEGLTAGETARMRPRLTALSKWYVEWNDKRASEGWSTVNAETIGELDLKYREGGFTLSGMADRIDAKNGELEVIDFKTGSAPSHDQVNVGFSPQLPLLAFMAENEAFSGVKNKKTETLTYVQLRKDDDQKLSSPPGIRSEKTTRDLIHEAADGLAKLIAEYDDDSVPYLSQPRVKFTNRYGDYDHLARTAEWASEADEGGEGA